MKKFITFMALLAFVAGCAKQPSKPHFVGDVSAILTKDRQSVIVTWKEAGLGNNVNIDYEASGNGTATYVCVNAGGQCPNAANKATVSGPVISSITLSSGQNGQIVGTLVLFPPGPGAFACPGGQTMTLSEFGLTGIQIRDITNNLTGTAIPDKLSAVLFTCP